MTTNTYTAYELKRFSLTMRRVCSEYAAEVLNLNGDYFDFTELAYEYARVQFPSVPFREWTDLLRQIWKLAKPCTLA